MNRGVFFFISLCFLFFSCNNGDKTQVVVRYDSIREPLMAANKRIVKKESDEIDQYIKFKGFDMITSPTGLRYSIYKTGNGVKAAQGMYARISYTISLLDGTVCYSSHKTGPKEFLIGQDNIESGLHEGVTYMHVGDKALFILPSYLAHGLLGDEDKIPPRSSVMYDIELISVR